MIQLYHRAWDHHTALEEGMKAGAEAVDRPTAALLQDLHDRGLLEDTLVLWGGEFGRTPMGQGTGRDHHILSFSLFMAGGGIKPGITYGETDDYCYNIVRDPVHVHDLNATIMHLMGVEHTKLTYRYQGRDFRLTDIHGEIIKPLLA